MSRLQFKAWDKKLEIMTHFDIINGMWDSLLGGQTVENQILIQPTGLHDSTTWQALTEEERAKWTRDGNMPIEWKGKMVFEGDLVTDGIYYREVRFEDGMFVTDYDSLLWDIKDNYVWVAGNKYQHHHLLGENK